MVKSRFINLIIKMKLAQICFYIREKVNNILNGLI